MSTDGSSDARIDASKQVTVMADDPTFWHVECGEGEPDFFVCIQCLNEVYHGKIPKVCPTCETISSFEAFTLDSINDWGTAELIRKATQASAETGNVELTSSQRESSLPPQPSEFPLV